MTNHQDHAMPTGAHPPARHRSRPTAPPAAGHLAETTPSPPGDDEPAYEVGYKRPPKHTRFRPGRTGNPRGRPKKAKSLNTLVVETLGKKVAVRTPEGTKRISRMEAVLQKTLEQAMKGNPRAQSELIRLWRGAIPEAADSAPSEPDGIEELTATDLAMLEAWRREIEEAAGDEP